MIVQTSFKGSCNGPTIQVDPRAKRLASNFPSLYVDLVGGDICTIRHALLFGPCTRMDILERGSTNVVKMGTYQY